MLFDLLILSDILCTAKLVRGFEVQFIGFKGIVYPLCQKLLLVEARYLLDDVYKFKLSEVPASRGQLVYQLSLGFE